MNKLKSLLVSARLDFFRSIFSTRGMVYILLCIYNIYFRTKDLVELAKLYNVKIEAVFLPYVHADGSYQMIFGLLCIYFFSDAPFYSKDFMNRVLRIGKKSWTLANIIKIFILSIYIILFELAASILIYINNIKIDNRWGSVWKTISISYYQKFLVFFSRNTIVSFTPFEATIRVTTMGILVVTMIGLIQYCLSLIFGKIFATAINSVFCILPLLLGYTKYPYMYFISPLSWVGIIEHADWYRFYHPGIIFMYSATIVADVVLALVILSITKKRDMNVVGD